MYHPPLPMDLRKCSSEACTDLPRFYKQNDIKKEDMYSCKCGEFVSWDGKSLKMIRPSQIKVVLVKPEKKKSKGYLLIESLISTHDI